MPLRLPKARSDLEYFDREIEGEEVVVVRDPVRGTYHKFNVLQAAMLRGLDGVRTLDQMVEALSEEFEVEIPRASAERFVAHARDQMLLDVASYNVSDAQVQKRVLKELAREGFRFRGPGSGDDKELPARIVSAEAVMFMGGIRHLQAAQPARALDYFCAVLELNPRNSRAKMLVDVIQRSYVKVLSGATTDFPTFAKLDPTRLLAFLDRTIGPLVFRWPAILIAFALAVGSAYGLANTEYPRVQFGTLDVILAYVILLTHAYVHELGHGLACYHYGGKVPEIGFIRFYYVAPFPYCDTSSSYLFKQRRHKILVQLAGTIASLVFLAVSIILLAIINPQVSIYGGLHLSLYLSAVMLLPNLVPFLKLDGYYALCDVLGTPNLRERSFRLLKGWLGARLLGLPEEDDDLPARKRRWFVAFAIASVLFTVFWLYQVLFALAAPVVERWQGTGLVLSVIVLGYLMRRVIWWPLRDLAKLLVRERRRIFTLRRTALLLVLLGLVIAPWTIQWPVLIDSEFVLVPSERREVRAEVPGVLERVLVREGDHVRKGQPIAILENVALTRELRVTEADLAQLDARLAQLRAGARDEEIALAKRRVLTAMATRARDAKQARTTARLAATGTVERARAHDTAGSAAVSRSMASAARWQLATLEAGSREEVIAAAEAMRSQLVAQRDRIASDLARLTIRSPIDGIVATKHLQDRLRSWLKRGDSLLEIHDASSFVAEIRLPASAPLGELEIGDEVALRAEGAPHEEIACTIVRIRDVAASDGPASRGDLVVVTSPFTFAEARAGMRGHARLYGRRRSLAYAWLYLPLERLVRVSLWALM